MKFCCPLLVVEDMARARAFYEQVLGCEVVLDFGENITFKGDFALQTRGSWAGFLHCRQEEIRFGGRDAELYFETEDIDAFLARLAEHPLSLVHPPLEYPWGQRVVRFYDPDRHIVEVGEAMEEVARRFLAQGMTVEEVAARTQHPVEFVRQCLPGAPQAR